LKTSAFGEFLATGSGILQLMEDAGEALAGNGDVLLLGGGNPARIPEVQRAFREAMGSLLDDAPRFDRIVGDYDGPQGNAEFLSAITGLLNSQFNWGISENNVALTNGSQTSFFVLFNMFAGTNRDGKEQRILLPLIPEYIGYTEMGLGKCIYDACKPSITLSGDHQFKYHVDFEHLQLHSHTSALCVSRPTNPTGNVLTDAEIEQLDVLATERDLPLIIDGAYGTPFPNIIFTDATPFWDSNIILCLSLSKLGLAGVRTGIVIAHEDIIQSVKSANAILNLTPGSFGPGLTTDMVRDGSILEISNQFIRPFYQSRAEIAINWLESELAGYPFRVHTPEGAIFLWLWFKDLPITSEVLYQRLKARDVLVIPGEHFFPGLTEPWKHRHECIRVSYAQDQQTVERGIAIIAEEVRAAYDGEVP